MSEDNDHKEYEAPPLTLDDVFKYFVIAAIVIGGGIWLYSQSSYADKCWTSSCIDARADAGSDRIRRGY